MRSNEIMYPYLTTKAKRLLDWFTLMGVDRDLCFSLIEMYLDEEEIYELPEEEKSGSNG